MKSKYEAELERYYDIWLKKPEYYKKVNPFHQFFAGIMTHGDAFRGIALAQKQYQLRTIASDWLSGLTRTKNPDGTITHTWET